MTKNKILFFVFLLITSCADKIIVDEPIVDSTPKKDYLKEYDFPSDK